MAHTPNGAQLGCDRNASLWEGIEWLLVEAKANIEELLSDCGAKDPDSIALIQKTLNHTKIALGAPAASNWMQPYYQYCNRLAALYALNQASTPARLLDIYFLGDTNEGRTCPVSVAEAKRDRVVGIPAKHHLSGHVHDLFVWVDCRE